MRVGVVAEGWTEHFAIEEIVRALDPAAELMFLIPSSTPNGLPYGWRGVKRWCEEMRGDLLPTFLRGVKGAEIDVLVVHADCSMAHNLAVSFPCADPHPERGCPSPRSTADGLRRAIQADWLARAPASWLVLMCPSRATDAWLLAARVPVPSHLECIDAEAELLRRHVLKRKIDGGAKKPRAKMKELAAEMRAAWDRVTVCLEAERFEAELRGALAAPLTG